MGERDYERNELFASLNTILRGLIRADKEQRDDFR